MFLFRRPQFNKKEFESPKSFIKRSAFYGNRRYGWIIFIAVVLAGAAYSFGKDIEEFVLTPIEKML